MADEREIVTAAAILQSLEEIPSGLSEDDTFHQKMEALKTLLRFFRRGVLREHNEERKPTAPGEASQRERELARIVDGALLAIEETSDTLEEHSQRNQAMLAEQFAAYRKELAEEPASVLSAAEQLLRSVGIVISPTTTLLEAFRAQKERAHARHH